MKTARGQNDGRIERDADTGADTIDAGVNDAMFDLGGDERRMHVRAYNHWVSLLKGRPYPPIADLDPAGITDFGPHSVLLDFSAGVENPGIAYLGQALREECALEGPITSIADVPSRSLLSRLTDHYLQIIANRAPIGFEAEFVGSRGRTTLYRGILMPFSSSGANIDFLYGVINWKELVDDRLQATLDAELDAAVRATPRAGTDTPIWADGPSGGFAEAYAAAAQPAPAELLLTELAPDDTADRALASGPLDAQLAAVRASNGDVRAADAQRRAALYRALGRAHDFVLATDCDHAGYARLLAEAGIPAQADDAMTPAVALLFGGEYPEARLADFATVLRHARRQGIVAGGLAAFLGSIPGGIKAVVGAERLASAPAKPRRKRAALAN
ncbi:hypothetical protein U1701_08725 [Sphingomonas sp. PB2P19]|uniref:PAS domain-containing protein n=1 Tax=Sphingomonas rhamnosi TaxID=3096156 RepID=UPI002FCA57B2